MKLSKISDREPSSDVTKTPETISKLKKLIPGYYRTLENKATGKVLFNQLRAIQARYLAGVGAYNELWGTYEDAFIDDYDKNKDAVLDVYSSGAATESDGYTFANRMRDKKSIHIHNDSHFVFPVEATPRDNSFEPIDTFKGVVGRAALYYVLTWKGSRWDKHKTGFHPFEGSAIGGVEKSFLNTYIKWNHLDPVCEFDIMRNNAIAKKEDGIRNPFIDMPKLIDLIWDSNDAKDFSEIGSGENVVDNLGFKL